LAAVNPELLITAVEHGPGMHGGIAVTLIVVVLVGGLAYLVYRGRRGRK
jgi:hypothetical protein